MDETCRPSNPAPVMIVLGRCTANMLLFKTSLMPNGAFSVNLSAFSIHALRRVGWSGGKLFPANILVAKRRLSSGIYTAAPQFQFRSPSDSARFSLVAISFRRQNSPPRFSEPSRNLLMTRAEHGSDGRRQTDVWQRADFDGNFRALSTRQCIARGQGLSGASR